MQYSHLYSRILLILCIPVYTSGRSNTNRSSTSILAHYCRPTHPSNPCPKSKKYPHEAHFPLLQTSTSEQSSSEEQELPVVSVSYKITNNTSREWDLTNTVTSPRARSAGRASAGASSGRDLGGQSSGRRATSGNKLEVLGQSGDQLVSH